MKTMLIAVAMFGLASTMARAESEGGPVGNTLVPVATAQNGQAVQTYVTQSSSGTWLFAPSEGGGTNN